MPAAAKVLQLSLHAGPLTQRCNAGLRPPCPLAQVRSKVSAASCVQLSQWSRLGMVEVGLAVLLASVTCSGQPEQIARCSCHLEHLQCCTSCGIYHSCVPCNRVHPSRRHSLGTTKHAQLHRKIHCSPVASDLHADEGFFCGASMCMRACSTGSWTAGTIYEGMVGECRQRPGGQCSVRV